MSAPMNPFRTMHTTRRFDRVLSLLASAALLLSAGNLGATVTAVDKATRKLTLKGPRGKSVDAVVSDEVRNFDQIKVGDEVVVQYREALSLELRKTKGKMDASETGVAATAVPRGRTKRSTKGRFGRSASPRASRWSCATCSAIARRCHRNRPTTSS